MKAEVLDGGDSRRWLFLGGALLVSFALHAAAAFTVSRLDIPTESLPTWVQVAVQVNEPPPPPEPVPPPKEEQKPKPNKQVEPVELPPEPIPVEQLPPTEPPPERKQARRLHGIDANSFTTGSGGGPTVRAGTTTAVKATDETMTLDQAKDAAVPYARVSTPPKLKSAEPFSTPEEVAALDLEGVVEVALTISTEGVVTQVTVVHALHPLADAACVEYVRTKTRWAPGQIDGQPVPVTGLTKTCRFAKVED